MLRIFKGKWHGPGVTNSNELFIQIGVQFRALLHNFTPSEWIVFTAIALHMDEDGLAYPSYDTLSKETGLGRNAIARALNGLCEKTIDGYPVLIRWRNRDESGKFTSSNRYKIFPTEEETNQSIEVATVANTNGGETVLEEEPTNKAEPVLKNITTKDSGATAPGAPAETPPTLPVSKRAPNPLWDAVVEYSFGGTVNGNAKRIGRLVRDMRKAGIVPGVYIAAALHFRRSGLSMPRGLGTIQNMITDYTAYRQNMRAAHYDDGLTDDEAAGAVARALDAAAVQDNAALEYIALLEAA